MMDAARQADPSCGWGGSAGTGRDAGVNLSLSHLITDTQLVHLGPDKGPSQTKSKEINY